MYTDPKDWDLLIVVSLPVEAFVKSILGYSGPVKFGVWRQEDVKGKSIAVIEGETELPLSFASAAVDVTVLRFDPPLRPYENVSMLDLSKRFVGIKTYSVYDMDDDTYEPLPEDDDALLAESAEDPFFIDLTDMSDEEFRKVVLDLLREEDETPEPLPSVRSMERRVRFHRDPDLEELARRSDMLSELEAETGQMERLDI